MISKSKIRRAEYLSVKKLKNRMKKEKSLTDILNTVFHGRYGIYCITPLQMREEIAKLAELVNKNNPSIVMEIGTHTGGTFYIWARYLKSVSKLISLDFLQSDIGLFQDLLHRWLFEKYPESYISLFRQFSKDKKMFFIRKNSHSPDAKWEVEKALDGDKIDFLFIDGDHSYEGVKKDFEMYSDLVKDGGLIAFHDICPTPPEKGWGVYRFWQEVKKNFRHKEIVKDWSQGDRGIGVIFKPKKVLKFTA